MLAYEAAGGQFKDLRPFDRRVECEVEILEGVQPGERIVISGTDTFEDAERVAIND